MLNRDVCLACLGGRSKDDLTDIAITDKIWYCPTVDGYRAMEQDPPKGCLKLMEQGVAAARTNHAE
jgi:hypothetical protein